MAYDNTVSVEASLPNDIRTFEYTRNCHFVRFKRKSGQELKLVPSGQMLYECHDCDFYCYADSNHGELSCPKCKGSRLIGRWMRPQTVMIPEDESDFEWPGDYPNEE